MQTLPYIPKPTLARTPLLPSFRGNAVRCGLTQRRNPMLPLAVGSPEAWKGAARKILERGGSPFRAPEFGELYGFALAEGRIALRTFDALDAVELVNDFFSHEEQVRATLTAISPKAYFRVSVKNRAIDLMRRRRREEPLIPEQDGDADGDPDADRSETLDRWAFLSNQPEKVRAIVTEVALGADREELAGRHGTTRVNVDQIVSRFRREYQKYQEPRLEDEGEP